MSRIQKLCLLSVVTHLLHAKSRVFCFLLIILAHAKWTEPRLKMRQSCPLRWKARCQTRAGTNLILNLVWSISKSRKSPDPPARHVGRKKGNASIWRTQERDGRGSWANVRMSYLAGRVAGRTPPPQLRAPRSTPTSQCWPSAETHTHEGNGKLPASLE